jgi:hypothetical protein
LWFVGRVDNQVKVRGYRVELGEIEAALRVRAGALEAVVTASGGAVTELTAYVQFLGSPPTTQWVRASLEAALPRYMVPSNFRLIEQFPLNANGKIDRTQVSLAHGAPLPTREGAAPVGPAEELVARTWHDVLGVFPRRDDDFFSLGGQSLAAVAVASRLRERGSRVSVRDVFEHSQLTELAALVEHAVAPGSLEPAIVDSNAADPAPLTRDQERLLFLHEFSGGSAAYHVPLILRLLGRFDPNRFAEALEVIAQRHELLRSSIVVQDGRAVQVPRESMGNTVYHDLSSGAAADRSRRAMDILRTTIATPFDLAASTWRASIVRLSAEEHAIGLVFHHIVFDEWSRDVLFDELNRLYPTENAIGKKVADLPMQFADYARHERARPRPAQALGFWVDRLRGYPFDLGSAPPEPDPAVLATRTEFTVAATLANAVRTTARRLHLTPFAVYLTAYALVLAEATGQERFLIGVPYGARDMPSTEQLIGFFTRTLALPADAARWRDLPLDDLVSALREVVVGLHAHSDISFEELVRALQPRRSGAAHPLFQAWLTYFVAGSALALPGITATALDLTRGSPRLGVALELSQLPSGDVVGVFETDPRFVSSDAAAHWSALFQDHVQGVVGRLGGSTSSWSEH